MSLLEKEGQLEDLQKQLELCEDPVKKMQLEMQIQDLSMKMYHDLDAWDRVYLARHPHRPKAQDYLQSLFHTFYEMHGDRHYGDDRSIIGGIAMFEQTPVTVIAQAKGKDLQENLIRNFGMPNPEGYRKALRLAKEAENFIVRSLPLLIHPALILEKVQKNEGQAEAIAQCLFTFSNLKNTNYLHRACLKVEAAEHWHSVWGIV